MRKKLVSLLLVISMIFIYASPAFALSDNTPFTIEGFVGETSIEVIFTVSKNAINLKAEVSNITKSRMLKVATDIEPTIQSNATSQTCCLQFTGKHAGTCELDYSITYSLSGKKCSESKHIIINITNEKTEKAKEALKQKASDVKESASEAMSSASSAASDAWDATKNKASEIKEDVTNKAGEVKDTISSAASDAWNTTKEKAGELKKSVVNWYNNIDFSKFKAGWDAATDWMGAAYSAAASVDYLQGVSNAINDLGTSINSAKGLVRGIPQEAGFTAEKWHAGTFNIDAAARGSSYKASVVGSTELGSADVVTNYGEQASLKYYQSGSASAKAQATTIIKKYTEYASGKSDPISLEEYMDMNGYDPNTQSSLLPLYDGQTRIIPSNQISEATKYLQGKIDKLSPPPGADPEYAASYQQTLDNLRNRLVAPDGTSSKPATYEEMQAIAELSQKGEFRPEDFGLTVSQVIPAKYILKQAMGTGLEVGAMKTLFTIGPDVYAIISEAIKTGNIDQSKIKDTGIEGIISMSEGFVEGSLSRIVIQACQEGLLGEALKNASPNVVGSIVFLTIEAVISGYSLAKGEITPEEYGNMMADRIMITVLAMPVSAAILWFLPGAKLFTLIGCLAGGMIASGGYTLAKEAVLEFVDGGGFEAIIPVGIADKIETVKDKVANMNWSGQLSNLKEYAVSTASNGYITIKSVFSSNSN